MKSRSDEFFRTSRSQSSFFLALLDVQKSRSHTSLNRGQSSGEQDEFTSPTAFNSGTDDLSPAGDALSGDLSGSDLLATRDSVLDAFSDPLK